MVQFQMFCAGFIKQSVVDFHQCFYVHLSVSPVCWRQQSCRQDQSFYVKYCSVQELLKLLWHGSHTGHVRTARTGHTANKMEASGTLLSHNQDILGPLFSLYIVIHLSMYPFHVVSASAYLFLHHQSKSVIRIIQSKLPVSVIFIFMCPTIAQFEDHGLVKGLVFLDNRVHVTPPLFHLMQCVAPLQPVTRHGYCHVKPQESNHVPFICSHCLQGFLPRTQRRRYQQQRRWAVKRNLLRVFGQTK